MTEKTMFEKNLEMWEKFVSGNMDLMFKSMEKTMEGSQAFQKQVVEAVNKAVDESQAVQEQVTQAVNKTLEGSQTLQERIGEAVNSALVAHFEATRTTLQTLERQMETMSAKVDEFIKAQSKE